MNANDQLIETLVNSQMYRDYERAYSEATGMPVTLRSPVTWELSLHGKAKENPFCALVATKSRTCADCLQAQDRLCQAAKDSTATLTCNHGLSEAAVPVKLGEETIGYLQTGQVLLKKPSAKQFERVAQQLEEKGLEVDPETLKRAYFETPVVSQKKFDSTAHLLADFANHLSLKANQIKLQQSNTEPPVISKAKQYIEEHHADDLSLGQVAAAVHTSTFYFCKLFKRSTGINFTEFVSRLRTEKAKNLLLNPNLRVSEIAYAVGFQSLTHFNRIFKRVVGQSPTEYREQLPKAA